MALTPSSSNTTPELTCPRHWKTKPSYTLTADKSDQIGQNLSLIESNVDKRALLQKPNHKESRPSITSQNHISGESSIWQSLEYKFSGSKKYQTDQIYIARTVTEQAIAEDFFKEFQSDLNCHAKMLYYYLKWQFRMQYIDRLLLEYKYRENDESLLLFNTELHDKNSEIIYAVGIDTDEKDEVLFKQQYPKKKKFWRKKIDPKMSFMTGSELKEKYGIIDLPKPSRNGNMFVLEKNDKTTCNYRFDLNDDQLLNLNVIKRNKQKNPTNLSKKISIHVLKDRIKSALEKEDLVSVILFDKKTKNGLKKYYVDKLLRVEIFEDEWIGIVFHDNKPIELILDECDILNKIQLYDPSQRRTKEGMFSNTISDLIITRKIDEIEQLKQALIEYKKDKKKMREQFEITIKAKDDVIKQQDDTINALQTALEMQISIANSIINNTAAFQHIQNQSYVYAVNYNQQQMAQPMQIHPVYPNINNNIPFSQ